jgi:hypothetical protein
MPLVDQGETYSFRLKVTDASGVAGAPGSTPTVLVTLPDNTTSSPTVTPNGTGIYDVDFTTTIVGRYTWTATATGGVLGTATRKWAGTLDVEDPATLLVDTSDALAHLRASGVIVAAGDLEQLRWLCHVATDAVERDLGFVLVRRTITDTFDGDGRQDLQLRRVPPNVSDTGFLTVGSVTENGVTLTANDYVLRRSDWTLRRGQSIGYYWRGWYPGTENITVTYTAGCTNPPPILRKVALNGVQRMWQASQQSPHPQLEDVTGDVGSFIPAGSLTPLEFGAYQALRAGPGVA